MFDFHLLRIKERGIRSRIFLDYVPEPPLKIGVDEAQQLGFDVLLFPAMVLSFGGFGALLIMVLEHLIRMCCSSRPKGGSQMHVEWAATVGPQRTH